MKFQKSNLEAKFTRAALSRPYPGPNSWAPTYGAHKEHLEFTLTQYRELQSYANQLDITFSASAMDIESLHQLRDLNVPFIKIGSGDANNVGLLETAGSFQNMPLIISTGMQNENMIRRIVQIMDENGRTNVALLHCVSSYPTPYEQVGLRMMERFKDMFPGMTVGYSGHERGIVVTLAAVALGAKV